LTIVREEGGGVQENTVPGVFVATEEFPEKNVKIRNEGVS